MSASRRHILAAAGGLFAWAYAPRASSAAGIATEDHRLLVLLLRGGLDGLGAVPAPGDPAWEAMRGAAPRDGETVPLEGPFALNARMTNLATLYARGEALIVHAAHTPCRARSHFEAQDVLETGYPDIALASGSTGWLNRALATLPRGERLSRRAGLALTPTVPLIMRGTAPVDTWQPQAFPMVDADTVHRLLALYEDTDPALAEALRRGAAMDDLLGMGEAGGEGMRGHPDLSRSIATAARLMAQPDGPRVAMMNMSGWDTHVGQGFASGRMALQVAALDSAIGALRVALGPVWRSTVVLVATEFGRTVRLNGSSGTDHGSATCALLVGGAVRGGRVIADWPGLAEAQLLGRRDLRPTTDLRAVMKGVLAGHLGVGTAELAGGIFPESRDVAPIMDLVRAA